MSSMGGASRRPSEPPIPDTSAINEPTKPTIASPPLEEDATAAEVADKHLLKSTSHTPSSSPHPHEKDPDVRYQHLTRSQLTHRLARAEDGLALLISKSDVTVSAGKALLDKMNRNDAARAEEQKNMPEPGAKALIFCRDYIAKCEGNEVLEREGKQGPRWFVSPKLLEWCRGFVAMKEGRGLGAA